jgi:hypothetical protein
MQVKIHASEIEDEIEEDNSTDKSKLQRER